MRTMIRWLKGLWPRSGGRRGGLTVELDRRVEDHGWTAIYVGDYATAPAWTYTLGFHGTLGQPEVIIFDIPQDSANALLSEVFVQLKEGRLVLEDGKVWPGGEALPCVWRKVDRSHIESEAGWFTMAMVQSLARTGMPFEFEAFQLVLSDNAGRMPWEDGYDERLRPLQPALYVPL